MLYRFFKRIYRFFNTRVVFGGADSGRMPLEEQKKYLMAFPDPKDDYERSFFKYKCFCEYCYYKRKWMLVFYNIGAALILPWVRLKLSRMPDLQPQKVDALYENVPRLPNDDILPDDVRRKYSHTADITQINYEGIFLNQNAKQICQKLKKQYFVHFYFRLIVMIKLAQFSSYIGKYQPGTILFYSCEREYAGPLITLLCELQGTKYEAYMHGDYLYSLCFAFQRYSMYYTWDEQYNKMFQSLRCSFPVTVYIPGKLQGIAEKLDDNECRYFATYYFSDERKDSAEKIREAFDVFAKYGLRCKVRPHPRFSDMEMLRTVFKDYEIEDPKAYALENSIRDTVYVIGLNTTVLSQAFFSGKTVVIDDVSMPENYRELAAKGYIMIRRQHLLLSDLVRNIESLKDSFDGTCLFMR